MCRQFCFQVPVNRTLHHTRARTMEHTIGFCEALSEYHWRPALIQMDLRTLVNLSGTNRFFYELVSRHLQTMKTLKFDRDVPESLWQVVFAKMTFGQHFECINIPMYTSKYVRILRAFLERGFTATAVNFSMIWDFESNKGELDSFLIRRYTDVYENVRRRNAKIQKMVNHAVVIVNDYDYANGDGYDAYELDTIKRRINALQSLFLTESPINSKINLMFYRDLIKKNLFHIWKKHLDVMFCDLVQSNSAASRIQLLKFPTFGADKLEAARCQQILRRLSNLKVLELNMDAVHVELGKFASFLSCDHLHTLTINSYSELSHFEFDFEANRIIYQLVNLTGLAATLHGLPNLKVLNLGFGINTASMWQIFENTPLLEELSAGIGFKEFPPFTHLRTFTEHSCTHRSKKKVDLKNVQNTLASITISSNTQALLQPGKYPRIYKVPGQIMPAGVSSSSS